MSSLKLLFKNDDRSTCDDISSTFGIQRVNNYKCPSCGNHTSDEYEVDGVKYPIIFNEVDGSTMDGNIHDWSEVHFCVKCNTGFWFINGAY